MYRVCGYDITYMQQSDNNILSHVKGWYNNNYMYET